MANAGEVDLMSLGKHCQEETCKQLDFLPFHCDSCKAPFCVDHFQPDRHNCKSRIIKDSKLPQCPLCNKYIEKGTKNVDDNTQVERHIMSGCTALVVQKPKKNRCSEARCKVHSPIPFSCSNCYRQFCVKHRHPGDHKCMISKNVPLLTAR